jgi:hypothetical protein
MLGGMKVDVQEVLLPPPSQAQDASEDVQVRVILRVPRKDLKDFSAALHQHKAFTFPTTRSPR